MGLNQAGRAVLMTNYCAFSKDKKCLKWIDYEITRLELEEADELCHGNWVEIQQLQDRIDFLENLLKQSGIEISPEQ